MLVRGSIDLYGRVFRYQVYFSPELYARSAVRLYSCIKKAYVIPFLSFLLLYCYRQRALIIMTMMTQVVSGQKLPT